MVLDEDEVLWTFLFWSIFFFFHLKKKKKS
jgi:hypothetical protein